MKPGDDLFIFSLIVLCSDVEEVKQVQNDAGFLFGGRRRRLRGSRRRSSSRRRSNNRCRS